MICGRMRKFPLIRPHIIKARILAAFSTYINDSGFESMALDERNIGNGLIVTLAYGWSFEDGYHEGIRGFDTIQEARKATAKKRLYRCECDICISNKKGK